MLARGWDLVTSAAFSHSLSQDIKENLDEIKVKRIQDQVDSLVTF